MINLTYCEGFIFSISKMPNNVKRVFKDFIAENKHITKQIRN